MVMDFSCDHNPFRPFPCTHSRQSPAGGRSVDRQMGTLRDVWRRCLCRMARPLPQPLKNLPLRFCRHRFSLCGLSRRADGAFAKPDNLSQRRMARLRSRQPWRTLGHPHLPSVQQIHTPLASAAATATAKSSWSSSAKVPAVGILCAHRILSAEDIQFIDDVNHAVTIDRVVF